MNFMDVIFGRTVIFGEDRGHSISFRKFSYKIKHKGSAAEQGQ